MLPSFLLDLSYAHLLVTSPPEHILKGSMDYLEGFHVLNSVSTLGKDLN